MEKNHWPCEECRCTKIGALFVGIYGRVRRLQIKIFYAQNNQEHATGDGSQFVTTRCEVSCSERRVGAARPRGSSLEVLVID